MLHFEPLGPRLLVEPHEVVSDVAYRAEKAGLVLVDETKEKIRQRATTGTVTALSLDETIQALFKLGDVVVFGPHSGSDVGVEGRGYICLEDREVLGKLVEVPEPEVATAGRVQ